MDEVPTQPEGGEPIEPTTPQIGEFALLGAVITRPAWAFEQIAKKPRFLAPAIMIGLGYLILSIGMATATSKIMPGIMRGAMPTSPRPMPFDPAVFGQMAAYLSVCCFPLTAAISWFVWSSILFLSAMIAGSRGRYWTLFSAVGYAWVPFFFAYLLGAIATLILSATIHVGGSSAAIAAMNPVQFTVLGIQTLFTIWYVVLGTLALEKTMEIPRGIAIVIVIGLKLLTLCYGFTMAMMGAHGLPGSFGKPGFPRTP